MVRRQVQLHEDQYRGLRRMARKLGVSFSEVVRRCVALGLTTDERAPTRAELVRAALAVAGKFHDPDGRVAREHDRHLADAFRR